jgi:predicted kinase
MQLMYLMCGNVGVGKSHIARKIARQEGGIIVSIDEISSMCHGGWLDRYDSNLKDIYHSAEKALIAKSFDQGASVIIDRHNVNVATRQRYVRYWKGRGGSVVAINMGEGDNDSLHRRVIDGKGLSRRSWTSIHNSNLERWEPPSEEEGFDIIEDLSHLHYKFFAFDFDGAVVENDFPRIGEVNDHVIKYMRLLDEEPGNVIIIFSSRTKDYLLEASEFLVSNNIPFDYLNHNPLFLPNSDIPFCHSHISGRAEVSAADLYDELYKYEATLHE